MVVNVSHNDNLLLKILHNWVRSHLMFLIGKIFVWVNIQDKCLFEDDQKHFDMQIADKTQ